MPGTELTPFREWILARGRTAGTADLYCHHLKQCFATDNVEDRLLGDLSPNTKRVSLAALRAWCRFTRNDELAQSLADIKLPAPERVTEKTPLEWEDWGNLVDALECAEYIDENTRAAARMIAIRGFRVGDVCRLTPTVVRDGLDTGTLVYQAKSGRHIRWGISLCENSLSQFISNRRWSHVYDLVSHRGAPSRRMKAARTKIYRLFDRLGTEIGLGPGKLPSHRLRRTYAVHFLEEVGGDITKLKDHMGWASLETAMRYVDHSQQEELDNVARRMMDRRPTKGPEE